MEWIIKDLYWCSCLICQQHSNHTSKRSEKFRVQGDVLKWIQSYISDHEQYIIVDGSSSERSTLSYGVHQGSVLGPIWRSFLFCTYWYILQIWIRLSDLHSVLHSEKSPARPMLFYSTNYWHQFWVQFVV